MNINKIIALLIELCEFLNSRKVSFAVVISQILDEITSVKSDSEKLFIIEAAQKQLQGGMGSLNDVWICKENGHVTTDEQGDNEKLEEYRIRLRDLLTE